MPVTRKRTSFKEIVADAETGLRDLVFGGPRNFFSNARERMKDLPKANYDLGVRFASEGKWMDAIFRFKVVLYLKPNYPGANYNLGCCYLRTGKMNEARNAFVKALQQAPGNADVQFMLASVDATALPPNQRPTRMPLEMVTGFFSAQANGYDITEANNRYQAGKVIQDLVKPRMATEAPVVLDLGCGSGIASRPWRAAAASIRGVDVTPAMIALADKATHADKKLFDVLTTGDAAQLAPEITNGSADLVLLVNVAQFIGELAGTLNGASQALKNGGVLVVTTEPFGETGYGLVSATSRYGHSNAYVKLAAASAGLVPVAEQSVELYADVPANALVFTKGTN